MDWLKRFSSYFTSPYKYYLSICAIFQDEAPYLREWIDYHRRVGVQHFWLYNNNSSDNYKDVLNPYIKQGIVELIEWPSEDKDENQFYYDVQSPAYTHAINKAKGVSQWLAIIDSDEFIVPIQENTVSECLKKRYSECSGVCVNWQNFGTSHVRKLEPKDGSFNTINHFVYKMKWDHAWNNNFKSIVKPEHVLSCPNPHFCFYLADYFNVNTSYERVEKISPVSIDVMQLNHYWTRDEWYFHNKKLPRWNKKGIHTQVFLDRAALMNEEKDETIKKFVKN